MGESSGIFRRPRGVTSGQLRSVAERRHDDAKCLLNSGENARTNGAMYMGGFVIECLLKALLVERHPNLQKRIDPSKLSRSDSEVNLLLFGHALDEMLAFLPEVETKLKAMGDLQNSPIWPRFRSVCEEWTVYARYSPKVAPKEEARRFLETVSEAKQWLKDL